MDVAGGFGAYIAAAVALVASHAMLSARPVRPALRRRLGAAGFYLLYSAISLAALAAFVWAFLSVGAGPTLFEPPPGARHAAIALMPLAVFLVLCRLTTRPASTPGGIYRVSRFPGSVGVLLWALLHLLNMGDARRVLLFATMAAIAIAALVRNECQRRRDGGQTAPVDILPFASVVMRRTPLPWREIGWRRLAATAAVYLALLFAHPYVLGVDPLAGMD